MKKRGDSELRQLVGDAIDASGRFFGLVGAALLSERPVARLREEGVAEPVLGEPLAALERRVARVADTLEEGRERDELLEQKARLRAIRGGLDEWLGLSNKGHVYWAERGGRRQTIVTLRSAPVDVAPELERCLFGAGVGVVCTSATLALGGETGPFAARIGAARAKAEIVGSPFDFERNMRVYVAADIPLPSRRGIALVDRRPRRLRGLLLRPGRRRLARPLHELPRHAGRGGGRGARVHAGRGGPSWFRAATSRGPSSRR